MGGERRADAPVRAPPAPRRSAAPMLSREAPRCHVGPHCRQRPLFGRRHATTPAASLSGHGVDDHRAHVDLERTETADQPARFPARQLRRPRDCDDGRALAVGEERAERPELAGERDQILPQLAEAHHGAVLQQDRHEGVDPFERDLRHREQAQRVSRRRGVDDRHVVRRGASVETQRVRDRQDAEQLVEPGRRQIDEVFHHRAVVGGVERRATAQGVEHGVDGFEIAAAARREEARGVDLSRAERGRGAAHRRRCVADLDVEDVAERVSGIGGKKQHTGSVGARGDRERRRRRTRRLAHATLAGEQHEHASRRRHHGPPALFDDGRFRPDAPARNAWSPRAGDVGRRACDRGIAPRTRAGSAGDSRREGTERAHAAGLAIEHGDEAHRSLAELLAGQTHRPGFRDTPAVAERARSRRPGRHAIHDQLVDANVARLQRSDAVTCFGDAQPFGEQHPGDADTSGIAQHRRESAAGRRDLVDQLVGRIGTVSTAERLEEHAVLGLHVVENDGDPGQRRGHRQKTQRVAGWRGVDDHEVEGPARCESVELPEPDQLVHAGERKSQDRVDVVLVEIRSPSDDPRERRAPLGDPSCERGVGIELERGERAARTNQRQAPGRRPGARAAVRRLLESISQRVSRVCRDEKHPRPAGRGGEGGRRGAGGLADAALAGEEMEGGKLSGGRGPRRRRRPPHSTHWPRCR